MASTAAVPSGVTTGCAWQGQGESVTELMPFMNFPVHSYTCCSDRHTSPYWTSIRRWISADFTPSLLKNGWQNAVLLWCMLEAGPPSLHYYCAVLLHSRIVLPPAGHSSNHEYHCCQLTWQSSCVSSFYHTFNIFIWLSLECIVYRSFATTVSQLKMCDFSGERLLKILECYNFLWVRRRPDCSPAASFTNCVMTLHLLKVHPQTCLSIPITQKMPKFWVVTLLSQISCM
jgi:hypothetical protein